MDSTRGTRFARRYGFAAASAAYLFTLGMRSARNRQLIRAIAGHFGFQEDYPRELPVVDLHDTTRDSTQTTLHDPVGEDGEVSLLELLALARLVRERRPARILEVGTFNGRTTLNMAANAPPESRVITIDLPPSVQASFDLEPSERMFVDKPQSGARFLDSPYRDRI